MNNVASMTKCGSDYECPVCTGYSVKKHVNFYTGVCSVYTLYTVTHIQKLSNFTN